MTKSNGNPWVGAARTLLGALFMVFGLNGFLGFLPAPEIPAPAGAFFVALAGTGYMLPLIKGTEIVAGLALLSGRAVPLALTVLAPITVNILLFHLFLAPGLGIPLLVLGLQLFLAWAYRGAFRGILSLQRNSVAAMVPSAARSPHSGTSTA